KHDISFLSSCSPALIGKLETRFKIITTTSPFFLVTGNAFPAPHTDIGHFEHHRQQAVLSIEPHITDGTTVIRGISKCTTGTTKSSLASAFIQTSRRGLK